MMHEKLRISDRKFTPLRWPKITQHDSE